MEKLLYLLYQEPGVPGPDLRKSLLEQAAPAIRAAGATKLIVNVHDEDTAAGTPVWRSDPPLRAMVSFWLENADDRL